MKKREIIKQENGVVEEIRQIIIAGQTAAYESINSSMIQTYWNIGRRIVKEEQKGENRAEYGEHIRQLLSEKLTTEFGTSFSLRNLH